MAEGASGVGAFLFLSSPRSFLPVFLPCRLVDARARFTCDCRMKTNRVPFIDSSRSSLPGDAGVRPRSAGAGDAKSPGEQFPAAEAPEHSVEQRAIDISYTFVLITRTKTAMHNARNAVMGGRALVLPRAEFIMFVICTDPDCGTQRWYKRLMTWVGLTGEATGPGSRSTHRAVTSRRLSMARFFLALTFSDVFFFLCASASLLPFDHDVRRIRPRRARARLQ